MSWLQASEEDKQIARALLDVHPTLYRFAEILSIAARVDTRLLRNIRLQFIPESDSELETAFWFSELIHTRNVEAVTLRSGIARLLGDSLLNTNTKLFSEVKQEISRLTQHWPETDRLEQEMRWAILENNQPKLQHCYQRILKTLTLLEEDFEKLEISRWAKKLTTNKQSEMIENDWLYQYVLIALGYSTNELINMPDILLDSLPTTSNNTLNRYYNIKTNNRSWAKLSVTDADNDGDEQDFNTSNHSKKVSGTINHQLDIDGKGHETEQITKHLTIAESIKYVYSSGKNRTEATLNQRQPGLIETLIKNSIQNSFYDSDTCRTLFRIMLPEDIKLAIRETENLLIVLDSYTASLPWEMLQSGEEPLALRMTMIRQLLTTKPYREQQLNDKNSPKNACVIGNPSTTDFYYHFDFGYDLDPEDDHDLPSLSGATQEAQLVTKTLRDYGYGVECLYPLDPDHRPSDTTIDVFNILFKKPYQILMVAAHGEVQIKSRRDSRERTGIVLSDGILLTAAEIGQMEFVPDVVFLNCCHLAKTGNTPRAYNRLAYTMSRELIEFGVHCVIAAGWVVNDSASLTFSGAFFEALASGETFGKSVLKARRKTYEMHPSLNTWGAYQAYGDPNYILC